MSMVGKGLYVRVCIGLGCVFLSKIGVRDITLSSKDSFSSARLIAKELRGIDNVDVNKRQQLAAEARLNEGPTFELDIHPQCYRIVLCKQLALRARIL